MNPCPCGQLGNPNAQCTCSLEKITRYRTKLSAPLLDRIDMHITVQALTEAELVRPNQATGNESAVIRVKVAETRARQLSRQGCINAHLSAKDCESVCHLGASEQAFLQQTLSRLKLSARAFHRLLKVARTISDMREADNVCLPDLQQALSFKQTTHY